MCVSGRLFFFFGQVVELLVKRGADMSMRDCNEMSPLHLLVQNKLDVLAVWLVHNGADIYQKDRKLFSPLDYGLPSTQRELRLAAGEISSLFFFLMVFSIPGSLFFFPQILLVSTIVCLLMCNQILLPTEVVVSRWK